MPEEKVSQLCPECRFPLKLSNGAFWCETRCCPKKGPVGFPPAADAGPRQLACPYCEGTEQIIVNHSGWLRAVAPPVPQEAAARYEMDVQEIKTREYQAILKHSLDATAPDGAMRVHVDDTFVAAVEDRLGMGHGAWDMISGEKICRAVIEQAAALIRQAGSEREREAFESCAKELREHYNSDWDSTVPGAEFDAEILRILRKHLGRASRLLGRESNAL